VSIIKIDGEDESKRKFHIDMSQLDKAVAQEEEETLVRQARLANSAPDQERQGNDFLLPAQNRNAPLTNEKQAEFSQKIYMFPESFNALRAELEGNWRPWFHNFNYDMGMSPAYAMVFDAPKFVGMCNGETDEVVQFDSDNVEGMCKTFLNAFRKKRGVKPIE
jgi:hypothetical protein